MKTEKIKFLWNGIKVNGGELVRLWYSIDESGKAVSVCCQDYDGHLPADVFDVENASDLYTDYFEKDHATLKERDPLYRFAFAAAVKQEIHRSKRSIPYYAKRPTMYGAKEREEEARKALEKWQAVPICSGDPTAADLGKIDQQRQEAENRRKAEEQQQEAENRRKAEEQQQEQEAAEKMRCEKCDGRRYIEAEAEKHPVKAGEPVVVIQWSENPAFYSFGENELVLSVAAAENVLRHFDEKRHAENEAEGCGGYDKTAFIIKWTDENGEEGRYEGRYDLGDNEGGLIGHIRNHGKNGYMLTGEERNEIARIADELEKFVEKPADNIISVRFSPAVATAAAEINRQKQDAEEVQGMLDMMSFEQLEAGLSLCGNNIDFARIFAMQMAKRDRSRAVKAFNRWRQENNITDL